MVKESASSTKDFIVRAPKALVDRFDSIAEDLSTSRNSLLLDAMDFYIRYRKGYVDFDHAMLQRMNQMVESISGLGLRIDTLSDNQKAMSDLIIRYSAGDNYLSRMTEL